MSIAILVRRLLGACCCLLLAGSALAAFDSADFNAGRGPLEIRDITPAGEEVPPSRQIVLHFNRPVVPVGRMERDAAEIPVSIEPPLACEWRWLNTSSLACQLGEKSAMTPATRYTLTIKPGIRTEDGATLTKTVRHSFITERPKARDYAFKTWLAPGLPVIRLWFNQPVSAASAAAHLFFETPDGHRLPATVTEDPDYARQSGYEPGRIWLLSPESDLPLDSEIKLQVEPGLLPLRGGEAGNEKRVVVAFDTFPEFSFLGVRCRSNRNQTVTLRPGQKTTPEQFCDPLERVSLLFSSPIVTTEIKEQLQVIPDLAGGRADYDPWEGSWAYSRLNQPHKKGREYEVDLPGILKAYEPYTLLAPSGSIRDEFNRPLPRNIRQMFFTDHRKPSFSFDHRFSVLEREVETELPIVVNNLKRLDLTYETLTAEGRQSGQARSLEVPRAQDIAFRMPLEVRRMLSSRSGVVYGRFDTDPHVTERSAEERWLFSQVTPWNIQVKIGHFNTLVWVTDYASGLPVSGVKVDIYREIFPGLNPKPDVLAQGVTDGRGIGLLPGTEKLDPDLSAFYYNLSRPKLFVRCSKGDDLALLPLVGAFDARTYDEWDDGEGGYVGSTAMEKRFGHIHTWGTTAQGVYRAGDTVQFKLYVRNQDNRTFVPPPRQGYALQVIDPMGKTVHEVKELALNAFGAIDGEFTVAKNGAVGWYRFVLTSSFRKGEWEPMRVLISDFTPAPFRVATDLSGELFRAGETVKVSTQARLHAGGPYADAQARITARLTPLPFTSDHPRARGFYFDTLTGRSGEMRTVHSSEAAVDSQGNRETEFTLGESGVLFGRLAIESAVRDDRGKYVAAEATAKFVGRDRFVGLRQADWVLQKGKPARIEALAVDEMGTPAAGTPIHLTVEYRQTLASRVKGAGNAYLTHFEHQWLQAAEFKLTSGGAPADAEFTPERPGLYRITAAITDSAGRPQSTTLHRWAAGAGEVVWESAAGNALTILPEKSEYRVGEKGRYLVQNPFPGARALITVERYGVLKSWVETFPDSTAIVEFEVEPDYLPGFYLSVTVFSPRVDKPLDENQVDLGKPAFRLGYVTVPVRDPYKELLVEARPDREVYRPRETVTVDLQASLRQTKPGEKQPPMELAVAVLDEAVLDLIQGGKRYYDVYRGFYTLDPLDLRTYNLLMQLVGRQKFEKKGANAGGDGGPDLAMRSLFKFVSYWNPSLRTDAAGKARIRFEVPDNLTGWRVLVMAVTEGDRMGLGDASFRVNRPTELRPVLPNQVTEGDSFRAGFSVMNRTEAERTMEVVVEARGPLTEPARMTQKVTAPPYKRVSFWLPLKTKGTGELVLTAKAFDAADGDALEQKVPVRRRAALETAATYGTTTAGAVEERIAFPAGIRTDVGGVSVVAAPTVIGNLEGAFAYLRDYPYICWEQKLTKGVMASHFRQLRPYLPATLQWPEADTLPDATLRLAAEYQAPNGGMSYYIATDEYVSPYLSAYTAVAFNWLRAAGHPIPEQVEQRLHGYLQELLRRDVFPSFYTTGMASTVRAVALAALAPHGRLTRADLARYRPHLSEMSLFGKAHYLLALLRVDGTEELRAEAARAILAHANETGGKFIFSEELDSGYQRILASPLRDNGAVLSALLAYGETESGAKTVADIPFKLVRTITQGRGQRDRWENTQENMFCLSALIEYSRIYEREKPSMTVRALLDGTAFGKARFDGFRDPAATMQRPIASADPGRTATVRVEKQGSGRLYYAARLAYAPKELQAKPANAGIEVHREYSVERKGKWVLLQSPMTLRTGELVRVDLYLSLPAARNFVVVDDPVPGGLEPVNRDLATASAVDADKGEFRAAGGSFWFMRDDWRDYGYSHWSFYHRELRHEAARFYSEYLPAGNYHLSYVAQAIAPGEFTVLPLQAEEMYDPDVFGRGVPAVLKVERGE